MTMRLSHIFKRVAVASLWFAGILWCAILISWIASAHYPHGTYITRFNRYGIWCQNGYVQFRYGTKAEPHQVHTKIWVQPIPYSNLVGNDIRWDKHGQPNLVFLGWKPVQYARFMAGGRVTANGKRYEFGDSVEVWATPHLYPALLLTPFVFLLAWRFWKSRQHPEGTCPTCGYDLRATPDRCPECGLIQNITTRADEPVRTSSA